MKLRRGLAAALYLAAVTAACADKPAAPAKVVSIAEVCSAALDPAMEKGLSVPQRVTTEGFLGVADMFLVCSDTCQLRLLPAPGAREGVVPVSFKTGAKAAQMDKLPNPFREADVRVHARDGKTVVLGGKLRVTGGRFGSGTSCYVAAEDVEAL